MLFDMTIQTVGYSIHPDPHNEGGMIISMAVGIPMPTGPNSPPFILPMGEIKFPMQKGDAINFMAAIGEAAENVPDPPAPSKLILADQVPDIDVSDIERRLRGK